MLRIFTVILGVSLAGGAVFLLFLLLSPLLRRYFSAGWHRGVLCLLLSFFAVPAGMLARSAAAVIFAAQALPSLPFMGEVPEPLANLMPTPAAGSPAAPFGTLDSLPTLFAALWLCVAIALLARKIASLLRFRRALKSSVRPVEDNRMILAHRRVLRQLGLSKNIRLCQSPHAGTPMLVGLARTAVILPDIEWSQEELTLVLRHELTHHRHRDLWVKLVGAILCALHWFNPCIWLLAGQLERWMELACDASVVCNMDMGQRRVYGNMILSTLGRAQPQIGQGICATFCENKKNMKERLTAMLNTKKPTRKIGILSAFVLALLCAAGTLMGAAAYSPEAGAVPNVKNDVIEKSAPDPHISDKQEEPAEENALDADVPAPLEEGAEETDAVDFLWPVDGGEIAAGLDSYPGHTGIDIPRPQGTGVYASASGTVTLAKSAMAGYGKYIVVDHGGGYQTLYAQCDALFVETGDEVEAGQVIATVGRSGHATGNHLHFELRYNGEILDPEQYIVSE